MSRVQHEDLPIRLHICKAQPFSLLCGDDSSNSSPSLTGLQGKEPPLVSPRTGLAWSSENTATGHGAKQL